MSLQRSGGLCLLRDGIKGLYTTPSKTFFIKEKQNKTTKSSCRTHMNNFTPFCFELGSHVSIPGWPQIPYIVKASLELLILLPHVPSPGVLGCTTPAGFCSTGTHTCLASTLPGELHPQPSLPSWEMRSHTTAQHSLGLAVIL